jgi:hypothetical protein
MLKNLLKGIIKVTDCHRRPFKKLQMQGAARLQAEAYP